MAAFALLAIFGIGLLFVTCLYLKGVLWDKKENSTTEYAKEEPIKDAEFKPVEEDSYIHGSYEKVELHLSSGVDYIEYIYYNDNDELVSADKATKCKIRECAADGTVMRELWGKPYKNHISDHIKDMFGR